MIERFESFTLAMSEIPSCWGKIATSEMAVYGLKGPNAKYLITLLKNPQGITAAKLCELCYRDKAEISRAMSNLEKKGLITRENTGPNSYRALIKLTDEGKKAAQHIAKRVDIAVELGGKGIGEKEREIFYSCLEKIAANLREISKEGLPENTSNE